MGYSQRLAQRQAELGRPIRIGLVGAGQMGRGYVAQTRRMTGMEVVAIADIAVDRATAAFASVGIDDVVTHTDTDKLVQAVEDGRVVATADAERLLRLPIDIVVEATGVPDIGARIAMEALLAGLHVGLLNVETDVTVGWLLSSVARSAGLIYTVCRGDEPVEAKRLVDYARDLSFEIICAGKGKNNPLDVHATPDQVRAEAIGKHMNPKMLTSFVDGSKAMIEMVALANAAGLQVSKRGMHGPATTIDGLAKTFSLISDGGILDRGGVVDYATGPVAPGVFAVARTDEPTVLEELEYLKFGSGPYYAFYRPYHLASIEAPLSVAAAVLDHQVDLAPAGWTAEVVATAKRPLRAGEDLDNIGGTTVYGLAENAAVARAEKLLPLGLVANAKVVRDVAIDTPLTYDDVELDGDSVIVSMRAVQDRLAPTFDDREFSPRDKAGAATFHAHPRSATG
ncbi:MAG: NAD(P)H-dependent oxidoreductase [Acidothermaceae bacterium]